MTYTSAGSTTGKIDAILPALRGQTALHCNPYSTKEAIELCDVGFLGVPHTTAMGIVPQLLKEKKRVIDLSADYRLKDQKV